MVMTDKAKLADQLRADLADIPDLYERAWWFLAGVRCGDPSPIGGPSGSRPPIDLGVLDLLDEREKRDTPPTRRDAICDDRRKRSWQDHADRTITEPASRRQGVLPTLSSWVRDVDSARWDDGDEHQSPPTQRTVTGECGWLVESLDWITEQPWLPDMATDIRRIRDDLRAVTRDHSITREAKPCPQCGWNMVGRGEYDTKRNRHPWYQCTGCDMTLTTAAEIDRLHAQARDYVTLRHAAGVLGRPLETLRHWRKQGWVTPRGRDERGDLYSLAALKITAQSVRNGKRFAS